MSTTLTAIDQQTRDLVSIARESTITDDSDYAMAGHHLIQWAKIKNQINKTFDPVIESAHKAHKVAIVGRDKHLTEVKDACTMLQDKMSTYLRAMEKLAQDTQEDKNQDEFAPLPSPPPEIKGVSHRTTWSAEITDVRLLLQHCLANWDQWGKLVQPNQKALNQLARSMKDSLDTILPGVKAVPKSSIFPRAS